MGNIIIDGFLTPYLVTDGFHSKEAPVPVGPTITVTPGGHQYPPQASVSRIRKQPLTSYLTVTAPIALPLKDMTVLLKAEISLAQQQDLQVYGELTRQIRQYIRSLGTTQLSLTERLMVKAENTRPVNSEGVVESKLNLIEALKTIRLLEEAAGD